jgi:hypothetical protein
MARETPVPDLANGHGESPIEVVPVVVLSQTFPARPSWIPEIRNFVRRCLAESPLTDQGNREVGETVFRALLDAAGPEGAIQVSFRIFPEHVEVDVLHSNQPVTASPQAASEPLAAIRQASPASRPAAPNRSDTFADWMSSTGRGSPRKPRRASSVCRSRLSAAGSVGRQNRGSATCGGSRKFSANCPSPSRLCGRPCLVIY